MYKNIKKQNGEKFAQTLSNFHNGLLEIPDLDRIVRYAGRDAAPLLPYLMSKLAANDDVPAPNIEDPIVLLERAGYDAFYADTLEKQNSIQHYFQPAELLCTFNDRARYQNYHIIHAIKKNVQDIKREDFKGKEQREDDYGTSVISIQMLKNGGFISIKNRYNHAVQNCDNTFNSNPDHIIEGLSAALKNRFNVDFTASKNPLPDYYTLINQQIIQFQTERNNIYYGDGFWVQNGVVSEVNRAAGDVMFDEFIFENKTKTFKKINPQLEDSFPDDFNRDYGGNKKLSVKKGNLMLGDHVLIGAEQSRIKTLFLPALKTMGKSYLRHADALTDFNAPALHTMENHCLYECIALTKFNAPVLENMGKGCLRFVYALQTFNAPALKNMGNYCLDAARSLTEFNTPALKSMGYSCLFTSPSLQRCDIRALTSVPEHLKRFAAKPSEQVKTGFKPVPGM